MKVEKSDWDHAQKIIKKAATMETAMQNMVQENATLKSKISGLEEQIGKLKKFIEKMNFLENLRSFLKAWNRCLWRKELELPERNQQN